MAVELGELLWPRLTTPPPNAQAQAAGAAVRAGLAAPTWHASQYAVVLAEAQRIVDAEAERRQSADNKAAIYLAAIAAALPLLASTETVFWDQAVGQAPPWLTAVPMLATVAYLGAAGLWAVRVLRVSSFSRVDVEDIVNLQGAGAAKKLALEHLKAAYASRDSTNAKISSLKMTHEFVLRAAVAFALILGVEAGWSGLSSIPRKAPETLVATAAPAPLCRPVQPASVTGSHAPPPSVGSSDPETKIEPETSGTAVSTPTVHDGQPCD